MSDHDTDDWQVIDYTNTRIVPVNDRDDAEQKQAEFPDLSLQICRPGEDPDVMLEDGPIEDTEDPDVEVVDHDDTNTETESDETDGDDEAEVLDTEPVNDTPSEPAPDAPTPDFAEYNSLQDPLDSLPGWMKTEVSYPGRGDSSTTINKRGCQVIANYLGVDVQTDAIESAPSTGFEYAHYEAVAEHPDGRSATAHGVARADGVDQSEDDGWKVEMQAETRAYKRAVKQLTGGGVEAFAKEQEEKA